MEKLITFIIPFHNNAQAVIDTVAAIEASPYAKYVQEIILCHNGPAREIYESALHTFESRKGVEVLHDPRPGLGFGCRMGVAKVTSPYFLITGADLPFGFSDLNAWFERQQEGKVKPITIGSKLHPQTVITGRSLTRKLSTAAYQLVKKIIIPFPVPADTQGTIFMESTLGKRISESTTTAGFFYTSELVILAIAEGATFEEIPVFYQSNETGSSVRPLKDGLQFIKNLFHLRLKL